MLCRRKEIEGIDADCMKLGNFRKLYKICSKAGANVQGSPCYEKHNQKGSKNSGPHASTRRVRAEAMVSSQSRLGEGKNPFFINRLQGNYRGKRNHS